MHTKTQKHRLAVLPCRNFWGTQFLGASLLSATFWLLGGSQAIAQTQFPHRTSFPADSRTATPSSQFSRQYERIYLTPSGELLGAHAIFGGTILYIDRSGDIDLAARDYTAELDYDYRGRLNRIGNTPINYDYRGRVEQIGDRIIDYDFRSRLGQIGGDAINYTPRGQVSQIGSVTIQYDRGQVKTISNNYTNAGTRIIIISH